MAAAAAQVQASLRAKHSKQLDEEREEGKLNVHQRKNILKELELHRNTRFLSDLCAGKEVTPQDAEATPPPDPNAVDANAEIPWDYYGPEIPLHRPHFLSPWHYEFLKRHFANPLVRVWDPRWLDAYEHFPPPPGDPRLFRSAAEALAEVEAGLTGSKDDLPPEQDECHVIPDAPAWVHNVNLAILAHQVLVLDPAFNALVVACICIAGVLVGVQSYPSMDNDPFLAVVDLAVQIVFTVECVVKIAAEGKDPLAFWTGPEMGWNNFDFWLVFICWLPFDGGNVAFLRLLRLMRLLKLVGKVKQLQVIVVGLAKGLGSVSYIMVLMLLVFYLFAVLGVQCFRKNDPFHFGSLGVAMLSLFRCATLEDWSDVMYINFFGCDSAMGGASGAYYGLNGAAPWDALGNRNVRFQTQLGSFHLNECWHPRPQPLLATVYFITFILVAAFVMLSLFVGAVCGGMSDAMDAFKTSEEEERKERQRKQEAEAKKLEEAAEVTKNHSVEAMRDAFDACDGDGSGEIDAEELVEVMGAMGEVVTIETCNDIIQNMDQDGNGTLDFAEFVFMMTNGEIKIGPDGQPIDENSAPTDGDESGKGPLSPEEQKKHNEEHKERAESFVLARKLRLAWAGVARKAHIRSNDEDEALTPFQVQYLQLSAKAMELSENPYFVNALTVTILAAGANVGFQTELAQPGANEPQPVLDTVDNIILAIFTIEIVVKVLAEGFKPLRFFNDSWNCFDFGIVFACFIFMLPFMPNVSSLLGMLRLLRLLRVLKLVKALPELRIIIEALISGLGSITFVTIILFMFFYLYANIGLILFSVNDPMHFGNLQLALQSLFRAGTMDDWTDIMYINMLGCDKWSYVYGSAVGDGTRAPRGLGLRNGNTNTRSGMTSKANCDDPAALGWIAAAYMVSFIVFGSLVLLTLFIGVVATSMEEAKQENKEEMKREADLLRRARLLNIDKQGLELYRELYAHLDVKNEQKLDQLSMKPLLKCLPLASLARHAKNAETSKNVDKSFGFAERMDANIANNAHTTGLQEMDRHDIDKLSSIVDEDYDGFLDFSEFLCLMEFLKRVDAQPTALDHFRTTFRTIVPPSQDIGGSKPPSPKGDDSPEKSFKVEAATNPFLGSFSGSSTDKDALESRADELRSRVYSQALEIAQGVKKARKPTSSGDDGSTVAVDSDQSMAARALAVTNELAALEDVFQQVSELADARSRKAAAAAAAATPAPSKGPRFLSAKSKGSSVNTGAQESDETVPASNNTSFACEDGTPPSNGEQSNDAGNGKSFFGRSKTNRVHPEVPAPQNTGDIAMEDVQEVVL